MYNKIIHSLIKDESHILNEWILHNILNIGFDHIYIYDDQSEKSISEVISLLPHEIVSKVTIFTLEKKFNFYDKNEFKKSIYYDENIYIKFNDNKQFYFQNYFLNKYKDVSKWCLYCDVDEFIYLKDNNELDDILLEFDDYDIIYIPWLIYGSSFNIDQPNGLIIDNFKYHDNKYHELGKSICKLKNINIINNAHQIDQDKINLPIYFKFNHNEKIYNLPIHINHYQINSIKLYIQRKLRLEIGHSNGNIRYPNEIFLFMLAYNSIYSNSMDKYNKNINNILHKESSDISVNLNYKYSSNCLYVDNKLYFKISTYDELHKILNSSNIKYLIFDDELPKDFTINKYKDLNKDLSDMNDVQLLNHYILFGRNEKRKYNIDELSESSDDSLDYKIDSPKIKKSFRNNKKILKESSKKHLKKSLKKNSNDNLKESINDNLKESINDNLKESINDNLKESINDNFK